jgi:hypothetical protein
VDLKPRKYPAAGCESPTGTPASGPEGTSPRSCLTQYTGGISRTRSEPRLGGQAREGLAAEPSCSRRRQTIERWSGTKMETHSGRLPLLAVAGDVGLHPSLTCGSDPKTCADASKGLVGPYLQQTAAVCEREFAYRATGQSTRRRKSRRIRGGVGEVFGEPKRTGHELDQGARHGRQGHSSAQGSPFSDSGAREPPAILKLRAGVTFHGQFHSEWDVRTRAIKIEAPPGHLLARRSSHRIPRGVRWNPAPNTHTSTKL